MHLGYMLMSDRGPDGQPMDWRGFLRKCQGLGLEKVDLFEPVLRAVGETPTSAQRLLADLGLKPSIYCVPTDLINPDPAVRQKSMDSIRRGIEGCQVLGLRQLFSYGGQHSNRGEEALLRYVDGLERAADLAAAAGLTLSIENAGGLCHTYEELGRCLDLVARPNLKVTFDGGNFILAGCDSHRAAEALAGRVAHVHAKAFVSAPERTPRPFRYCPIGEGLVDYRRVLRTLAAAGFDGCVSFEPEGGFDSKWEHSIEVLAAMLREFRR